ncbi:hypothetical protein A9Q83_09545 [Alphaproteobacteria bacterium 46_93_T64]|nr:hypothetical protein A9Q83_09545 [Alphaproteobacteria bacterium 46_93_T64]
MPKPCYDAFMQTDANIKEILDFYLLAGVDEAIGETPVNQFDRPAPSQPAINIPPVEPNSVPAPKQFPIHQQPEVLANSVPASSGQGVQEANALANSANSILELKAVIENFGGCALKSMATNTVFARGNPEADLMIIDRAPSAEEDRSGLPFAGASGIFLAKMLGSIGLNEDAVYLSACLPWRPPGGRVPTREEQAICLPFIRRHIELASPKHILMCGEAAAFLLEKKTGINKLRGSWETVEANSQTVTALSIFHPTFLMEHPASKKLAWADLLKLKAALTAQL